MTIYGWDQSHFDVPSIGNAIGEGISFITHKAGGDKNDAELGAWWNVVKDNRFDHMAIDAEGNLFPADKLGRRAILIGAYWVVLRKDGAPQADAFLARLDNQCQGWRDGAFILQLDCEEWNNGAIPAPTKAQIKACADRLAGAMPKLRPIAYAPEWVYHESLSGLGYPLWASNYVGGTAGFKSLYPGDSSVRWAMYSGQTPAILQYSSKATIGGQTTCDANAFRGTFAQLVALLAPGWKADVTTLDADDRKWLLDNLGPAAIFTYDPGYVDPKDPSKGVKGGGISAATFGSPGNGTVGLGTALGTILARSKGYAEADAANAAQLLSAVQSASGVDAQVLAAALVPPLSAAILAGLPPSDELTGEDVEQAVRNVLVHGTE